MSTPSPVDARMVALHAAQNALAPFADRVYNDNGDITISHPYPLDSGHYERAYFASRKVAAALAAQAPGAVKVRLAADDVEWVVNDLAELGVKIGDQFFFLYKGRSLVYGALDPDPTLPSLHDEDDPQVGYKAGDRMQWRHVFKREFGECCHPVNYKNPNFIGTVSLSDSEDWQLLPAALSAAPPVAREEVYAVRTKEGGYTRTDTGVLESFDNFEAARAEADRRNATPAPSQQPAGEAGGLVEALSTMRLTHEALMAITDALDRIVLEAGNSSQPIPTFVADAIRHGRETIDRLNAPGRIRFEKAYDSLEADAARIAELEAEASRLEQACLKQGQAISALTISKDAAEARATKAEAERDVFMDGFVAAQEHANLNSEYDDALPDEKHALRRELKKLGKRIEKARAALGRG